MKRFYTEAAAVPQDEGFGIALDGRPVRTPGRALLTAPTLALAERIAREWAEQGEKIEPRAMRFTGLANAAIDRIMPDPASFATGINVYRDSDLLCYRADAPAALVARQAAAWDPLLDWADKRCDVNFTIVCDLRQEEARYGKRWLS